MSFENLLAPIKSFLQCETPQAWVDEAVKPDNLDVLLIDHMICELKAAQTAMWLIRKYAVDAESGELLLAWLKPYEDFIYRKEGSLEQLKGSVGLSKKIKVKNASGYSQKLVDKMIMLIKEELHHFYQVLEIMEARGVEYRNITSSRYAKGMMKHVKTHEPETLRDKLICGAYIEARSCERFYKLAPYVDDELGKFYVSLLRSEARHFEDYLSLAQDLVDEDISERVAFFGKVEAALIESEDNDFKFHSGTPNHE